MSYTNTVINRNPVHARPSVSIYNAAGRYKRRYSSIDVKVAGINMLQDNAVMKLMELKIYSPREIEIVVSGEGISSEIEEKCAKEIGEIAEEGFDEYAESQRKLEQQNRLESRME